jgi:hypothetical protein
MPPLGVRSTNPEDRDAANAALRQLLPGANDGVQMGVEEMPEGRLTSFPRPNTGGALGPGGATLYASPQSIRGIPDRVLESLPASDREHFKKLKEHAAESEVKAQERALAHSVAGDEQEEADMKEAQKAQERKEKQATKRATAAVTQLSDAVKDAGGKPAVSPQKAQELSLTEGMDQEGHRAASTQARLEADKKD